MEDIHMGIRCLKRLLIMRKEKKDMKAVGKTSKLQLIDKKNQIACHNSNLQPAIYLASRSLASLHAHSKFMSRTNVGKTYNLF
jgi:hypothetical protein